MLWKSLEKEFRLLTFKQSKICIEVFKTRVRIQGGKYKRFSRNHRCAPRVNFDLSFSVVPDVLTEYFQKIVSQCTFLRMI